MGKRPLLLAPDSGHHEVASDAGGERWAVLASLTSTAKLHGIDPETWLADVLERVVSGRTKANALHELLPWNWEASSGITPHPPATAATA